MRVDEEFLMMLAAGLPAEERMVLCGFPGDPGAAPPHAWRPRPWRPGAEIVLGENWNGYVTVGSFFRAGDGSFRRRADQFAAGRALMVDDVGTKVDPATVAGLPPSARVETSPGNEQWWYVLEDPEYEGPRFDGLIRAFISGKLAGDDPGMSGVTRVGRLPGYVNGKAAHNGWRTQLRELTDRRFSVEELLERFRLHINGRRELRPHMRMSLIVEKHLENNRAFTGAYKFLDRRGMLKRPQPDPSGWTEATCPWVDTHTGGVDSGAAIREPAEENEYYGAFRCHHGHCIDKGWAELTEWIAETATEELEQAATSIAARFAEQRLTTTEEA